MSDKIKDAIDASARLHLLPDAPPELIKAAYRELAKLNHPDKGGNEEAMKLLNEAYAKLAA
jgi:curved DNA-binding protein CbpA